MSTHGAGCPHYTLFVDRFFTFPVPPLESCGGAGAMRQDPRDPDGAPPMGDFDVDPPY